MHESLFNYFKNKLEISKDDFDILTPYFSPKSFKKNSYLLRVGEVCRHMYFVNSGCIRLYSTNEEGIELTRYFAFEGKFGTALSSLINQKPSNEYIHCLENSELLVIGRNDFYYLIANSSSMNRIYIDLLEMAYTTSQKRIYGFQGSSAIERLKWLVEYQPDIFQRISGKIIATYLGVTTYTLSRLKSRL